LREGCCGCGFAACDAHDAEHGDFREGGAGNEDMVSGGVEVRRRDLQTVVEEAEQIIRDHAFEDFVIGVTQTHPKAIELGAAEKGFAFGLEMVGELADEINGTHAGERDLLVLAVGSEQVDRIGVGKARGIEVTAHGLPVGEQYDDFLMRRGWGAVFQGAQTPGQEPICEFRGCMLC